MSSTAAAVVHRLPGGAAGDQCALLNRAMDLLDRRRLEQLSHELADAAAQLRTRGAGVRTVAGAMGWHSPAARAAAESLEVVLASALRLAAGLDGVADAVHAHGRRATELAARAATTGTVLAGRGVRLAERLTGL